MGHTSILNWDEQELAEFGRIPLQFGHNLHRHPLFTNEALGRLLEHLERDDYYVNTMDVTTYDAKSRREGEIRNLSGYDVLEAVRSGHIWILILRPDKVEPRYLEIMEEFYAEAARKLPSFRTHHHKMTILISSPKVLVHYHCDIPGQTLWQVRGNKKVYVYPNREPYLNQACLERIALGEAHEISLPFDSGYDQDAVVYDLHPGQMLHWPLNAPHRIVNGDCVNVSFTTEHFTSAIRRQFYVNYANGVLRKRLGWQRLSQSTSGPAYWAKFGVAAAYKLAGLQRKYRKVMKVDFAVDPAAPRGVRTIPAYEMRR